MAYTTINKSTDYFNTKLFTGNGSTNAITGVGFQPDLVWLKNRDGANDHQLYDAVRGATKYLRSESTDGEGTASTGLTSFDSDGFTVGSAGTTNNNGANMASWNWKAGTTSGINTTGADITPSSYSMNATSGISIIKFTGNGVDGAKIAHGLGAVPEMLISKRLDNSNYWAVYHKSDNTDYLVLNTTDAFSDAPIWKDSDPTSVYYQTDSSTSVNANGDNLVAYCFKSVTGFSKIGSYTGNGNSDGTFVYTGFKPAFVMWKKSSGADGWHMVDEKRDVDNPIQARIEADSNSAEYTSADWCDLVSNGIKFRNTGGGVNGNGDKYIYIAFGQSLVGSNNVPCTAR